MSLRKPLATALAAVTAAATSLLGAGAANAADVSLPTIENNTVSVRVENPVPGRGALNVGGQQCSGLLVTPYNVPAVAAEVLPLVQDGVTITEILALLGALRGAATVLTGPFSLPFTTAGRPGTLSAKDVPDDFYIVPVICYGGRDNAPMEINLFLSQVGNPIGAFEGSVTGTLGALGSTEGKSISLGSAELGVGSADGMVDFGSDSGSTTGSDQGSLIGVGFQGSLVDVTTGSVETFVDAGSTGSDAGFDVTQGSLETGSQGALDSSSLGNGIVWPAGSSNGSSIDAGSVIPVASDLVGSIQSLDLPSS